MGCPLLLFPLNWGNVEPKVPLLQGRDCHRAWSDPS